MTLKGIREIVIAAWACPAFRGVRVFLTSSERGASPRG